MNLLGILQKARPILHLQLLLAQNQLNLTVSVVDLAVLRVDLGVEVQGDGVCYALARRPGERDIVGGDFEVGLVLGDVGGLDVHVEVVALGLRVGRALGPGNWKTEKSTCQLTIEKIAHDCIDRVSDFSGTKEIG